MIQIISTKTANASNIVFWCGCLFVDGMQLNTTLLSSNRYLVTSGPSDETKYVSNKYKIQSNATGRSFVSYEKLINAEFSR